MTHPDAGSPGLAGLVRGVRAQHPRWNPAKVAHYLAADRRDVEAAWGGDATLADYHRRRQVRR